MRKAKGILVLGLALAGASMAHATTTVFTTATFECGTSLNLTLNGFTFTTSLPPGGVGKRIQTLTIDMPMSTIYETLQADSLINKNLGTCKLTATMTTLTGQTVEGQWTFKNATMPGVTVTAGGPSLFAGITEPFATIEATVAFTQFEYANLN
jgi:hypothetical protein